MWDEFLKILKLYPSVLKDLNEGCTKEEILSAESNIGVKFPSALIQVYLKNNGQCIDSKGIFKAVSGYDKYSRLKLLSLKSVENIWKILYHTDGLDVFEKTYIPFAADDEKCINDIYCIDAKTEEVFLLWTSIYDWNYPIDWQTHRFSRGKNMELFLQKQIEMYW